VVRLERVDFLERFSRSGRAGETLFPFVRLSENESSKSFLSIMIARYFSQIEMLNDRNCDFKAAM